MGGVTFFLLLLLQTSASMSGFCSSVEFSFFIFFCLLPFSSFFQFSLFFCFNFLNLLYFFYTYSFVCFSHCSLPLQLIFNVYKSSLSTSTLSTSTSIYSLFLYFFSFSLNIFVSFVFIALFPTWKLALVLFSSLCFS